MEYEKYLRTHNQLYDDNTGPSNNLDPEQDRRHLAIMEVLCRINEGDYQRLVGMHYEFNWFIPGENVNGQIYPFSSIIVEHGLAPHVKILYLSPRLEWRAFDFIVASVAHELAHIFLRHKVESLEPQKYDEQEAAAWNLIRQWGFEHEEQRHAKLWKRYYARQERKLAKLVAARS